MQNISISRRLIARARLVAAVACTATLLSVSLAAAAAPLAPPPPAPQAPPAPTRLQIIGEQLFNDANLSEPRGTACIHCHRAATGFADNHGSRLGVPIGSQPTALGLRNAMSNAYGAFVPTFQFRVVGGDTDAIGGHFWDGRADTAALQALGPFLLAREMNNPNAAAVVRKVAASPYAPLLKAEFGARIFDTPDLAFQKLGVAIAAFEATPALQPFSSKYDRFVAGDVAFDGNERRGMALFMDTQRANCIACHVMNPASRKPADNLFTDFAYYAEGIPRNKVIPDNANPGFFDLGLCGPNRQRPALTPVVPVTVTIEQFCGAFRMVSLRNVALRQAFMHNGFFKNLREVIDFYSTRNSDPKRWYGPAGVPNDLPAAYVANIIRDKAPFNRPAAAGPLFSPAETDDMLAFLRTLNDGFVIPAPGVPPVPVAPIVQGRK